MIIELSYTYTIQGECIQTSCFLDINSENSHVCIDYRLATVRTDGVGHTVGYNGHCHAWLDADAIAVCGSFGSDLIGRHSESSY